VAPGAGESVQPKGDRWLGLRVTTGALEYDAAFGEAKRLGLQFLELPQQWNEAHPAVARFDTPFVATANRVYPPADTALVLSLNPIDTSALRVPDRLAGKSFDAPEAVAEFCTFVDHVLADLSDVKILAVSVGNEVDAYLGDDPAKWAAYRAFFDAVAIHIRKVRPGVPVGVKMTRAAVVGVHRDRAAELNRSADVVMATYYALADDFTVRMPVEVGQDVAELCAAADGKPVYLLEAGFPSGTANGSSEALQGEFVSAVFRAWDRHAGQLQAVNFVWLHDLSDKEVAALTAYYGQTTPTFASFLGSLGLKTHDGRPKAALKRLEREAAARGW